MKRLIPLLLILCLCLCACKNDQPNTADPTDASTGNTATENVTETPEDAATEGSVPETTIRDVEVPEELKCVVFTGEQYLQFRILPEDLADAMYTKLMQCIPDRNKSNPAYQCEGNSFLVVFYDGPEFDGDWSENYNYYATLLIAENGVLSQTKSPFTAATLNYQLSAELYDFVLNIYQTEENI